MGKRTSRFDADDAELVRAAQAGCPDAFTELFRRHYPSVRRACLRRLGNSVDGDEAAQATFVRAFERLEQCDGQRRFGPWVHVIAHRLCVDIMRARARTQPEEVPVPVEQASSGPGDPVESVLDQERARHLREALSMLSDRQREAVVARTFEERGPGEIAAELGLSVGAVDSLLLRGRRRLARVYQRMAGERGAAAATVISTASVATGAAARPRRFASGISAAISNVHHNALQLASTVGLLPASRPPGHGVATAVLTAVLAVQSAPASSAVADRYEAFAATPPPSVLMVRAPVNAIPADSVGASAVDGSLVALVAGLLDAARPPARPPGVRPPGVRSPAADASSPDNAASTLGSGGFEPRSLAELAEEVLGPLPPPTASPGTESATGSSADLVAPPLDSGGSPIEPAPPKRAVAEPPAVADTQSHPEPGVGPASIVGVGVGNDATEPAAPSELPPPAATPPAAKADPAPPGSPAPPGVAHEDGGLTGPVGPAKDVSAGALNGVEDARGRAGRVLP